ncbi:MAG: hypothetical protein ACTSRZ_12645 [Promethearchaeota archaeon]
MEEFFQQIGKIVERFDSLSKVVDFVHEEITPRVFKEKTSEIFELNKKIVDNILDIL